MALIAEDDESMRRMLKKMERFLKKKGLSMNVGKTKIMCFRKARDRRKHYKFEADKKEIEMVK